MNKITKAESKEFNSEITKFINGFKNAIPKNLDNTEAYKWDMLTKYGVLNITLPKTQNFIFTIFCQFDGEFWKKAPEDLNISTYTGKWNFHISNKDECVNCFKNSINKIIIE